MTERRREHAVRIIYDLKNNLAWFPRYGRLREFPPPTPVIWDPHDGYMPQTSAKAYLRDVPNAELQLLDGGHWLLETNLEETGLPATNPQLRENEAASADSRKRLSVGLWPNNLSPVSATTF